MNPISPNPKTIERITYLILEQVAPEEEELFDTLFELYLEDPTPPSKKPTFNPAHLGSGVPDYLLSATPAIAAVVMNGLSKLQKQSLDYERGLQKLLTRVSSFHLSYSEILTMQTRMYENLRGAQLYGETPQLQHDRQRILGELNRISLGILGESFNSLMGIGNQWSADNLMSIHEEARRKATEWGMEEDVAVAISKAFTSAYISVAIGFQDD